MQYVRVLAAGVKDNFAALEMHTFGFPSKASCATFHMRITEILS